MSPEATGNRLPGLLRAVRHVVLPDDPHAIIWTYADEVNRALSGLIRGLAVSQWRGWPPG
jgi:hypothetical protein